MKQTYRVLLTRGMKGCYVCFEDAGTRNFFCSRMKHCKLRKQYSSIRIVQVYLVSEDGEKVYVWSSTK